MNNNTKQDQLWDRILRTLVRRSPLYFKIVGQTDDDYIIKVESKGTYIDPLYIKYLIVGMELYMGWVQGEISRWTVFAFVDGMNEIIADYFSGKEIALKEWGDVSDKLMFCFTREGYAKNNQEVNLDILRKSMPQE